MKLFLDSANLKELESCLKRGILCGITTNPSILSKEPRADVVQHIQNMANLCTAYRQNLPLSVEVFTAAPEEMFSQACELAQSVRYQNLAIKIPIGWEELEVIRNLRLEGIAVNCTCLFNEAQCLLAANAGANYISLFMGRMKDLGIDPLPVIANVRTMLHRTQSSCELIVGSIRHARDITDAYNAGAHIVTAGMKFFDTMSRHPQTTKSVQDFLNDFKAWQS